MNQSLLQKVRQRVGSFFSDQLWRIDEQGLRWWRRWALYSARLSSIVVSGYSKQNLPVRATALAYTTLLSLVPLLVVTFSLFKAFGGLAKVMDPIENLVLNNLATGSGTMVVDTLQKFIQSYRSGTVGLVGLGMLILTVLSLLTTIERTFNDIWGIPKKRGFVQRFTVYWTLMTIGPILLGISITVTGALQSNRLVTQILSLSGGETFFISKIPWLTTFALFTVLYLVMPNTKVRFRSALIGGIFGGALWEIAKYGYTLYASRVVSYSKIYGSLGIIPIFLVWLYYTWIVVLIGCLVTFADQNIHTYKKEKP